MYKYFIDKAKMIRFDERTGYLFPTDLGRTSSQFYIKYDTIEIFNELLQPVKNEAEIIGQAHDMFSRIFRIRIYEFF